MPRTNAKRATKIPHPGQQPRPDERDRRALLFPTRNESALAPTVVGWSVEFQPAQRDSLAVMPIRTCAICKEPLTAAINFHCGRPAHRSCVGRVLMASAWPLDNSAVTRRRAPHCFIL